MIIVDDNSDVNSLLSGIFTLKGFKVYKTFGAEECLRKLTELDGKIDVVTIDGKIAADRGAMLIVKIKKINPTIKIIAAADDESDKTRILDYGADSFITKPLSLETIADKVVNTLLKEKRLEDTLSK